MTTSLIRAAILGAWAFGSTAAIAQVEVQAVQHTNVGRILAVRVSEDIAPGDYERLLKGITANPGAYARKLLLLDSIGGSVPEAIRMGRLLREAGFDSLVPSGGVCQGTCVYLLAAGHRKTVRGAVAIHRPYFPGGDSALGHSAAKGLKYSPTEYFREMKIPSRLAEDLHRIEPANMRVLSVQELARYGLN